MVGSGERPLGFRQGASFLQILPHALCARCPQTPGRGAPRDLSYIPSPSAQNTILREDTAQ